MSISFNTQVQAGSGDQMNRWLCSPDRLAGFTLCASVYLAGAADARPPAAATLDLSAALSDLARQSRVELIFDPAQVAGIKVAARSAGSPKGALEQLLIDTRFTYRQVDPHTFVIVARAASRAVVEPSAPPPSSGPEIVVIGRRSQNIDLARGKDEIQPYWTASGQDIAATGATTLDDYFDRYLALNRETAQLSQTGASPRSQIDLRGLGADKTLVLVDGRRFAGIPSDPELYLQSDVNAIPVEAVDRVEVLATSAGGIFGIGATGGVVNIILKRDYHGALLSADSGVSDKGDGVEHRLYGRVGWQTPNGRTHVMVSASYASDEGLLVGDRDYATAYRARRVGLVGYTDPLVSSGLNIQSLTGEPLSFTPANGGASLGSSITYVPLGSGALDAAGLAALRANAGKQDISLAQDGQGALGSLIARTTRMSVMATFRQEIGSSSEAFLDYLRLDDQGWQQTAGYVNGGTTIAPGAAGNPFDQYITVSFPTQVAPAIRPERDLSQRLSGGLIRRFAGGWTLVADGAYSVTSLTSALAYGFSYTTPRVFAGVAALNGDLQPLMSSVISSRGSNRLIDTNLRVTGPIATLPGGAATLTVTGEFRRESGDGVAINVASTDLGSTTDTPFAGTPHALTVWSAFGEARLPILPDEGTPRPWRGLAAQVALRVDRYRLEVPSNNADTPVDNRAAVLAATLGLQSRPIDGMMLRSSVSTAATPPAPEDLQAKTETTLAFGYIDPERGGYQTLASRYTYTIAYGDATARPQNTETLSAGIVLEPDRLRGLRLSLDYTKLITRNEIDLFAYGDIQFFLDNEELYPGRIQRTPLTAADQALGYTGGKITYLNVGPLTGSSRLQTLDFALSYDRRLGGGTLHLRADGDWAMSFYRFSDPRAGRYDLVGFADGPLAWRANLGIDWSGERWSIGTQAQFYASYSLAMGTPLTLLQTLDVSVPVADILALQAREPRIPVQASFDLSFAFRPQGKAGMQIRMTVANVFDQKPPITASVIPAIDNSSVDPTPASGTAFYGDLRGRRFALNVRVPFGS